MPELKINESRDEDGEPKVLYLEGFIDTATVADLEKKFEEIISKNIVKVVLDFTGLTYLGSVGLSAILQHSSTFQSNGGNLVICSIPEKTRKVITMVGLENVVRLFDAQKDALVFFQESKTIDYEPVKTKEKASFPLQKECPYCKASAAVPQSDVLRCHSCNKFVYVDEQGELIALDVSEDHSLMNGTWFKLTIPSNIIYLNSVRAFLTSILSESKLAENDISDIELAVDEAVANIMEHAYGMDKTKEVFLSLFLTNEYLLIKLRDTGIPFDFAAKIKEEEKKNLNSQSKRGRGCYIIKKIMDKLDYQTIPDIGNELIMVRNFKQ